MSNPDQHVKTFYKLLQCLHHQEITIAQLNGNISKAFKIKTEQLNDFIKPAFPNTKTTNQIKEINSSWTKNILECLHLHYTESIQNLSNQLKTIGTETNIQTAIDKALTRAKKNFGKKLKQTTTEEFLKRSKALITSKFNSSNTASVVSKTNQQSNTTINSIPKPTYAEMVAAIPTKSVPKQTGCASSKTLTNSAIKEKQIQKRKPGKPKPPTPRISTRASSKMAHNQPNFQNKNQPLKGKKIVHGKTHYKNRDWKLGNVFSKTLIIGDSNLKQISQDIPDNVHVESFSGAKVGHAATIINKYPNCAPKPKNIVVSIGLNDHKNKPSSTRISLRKMVHALNDKFPKSNICIPEVNAPPNLDNNGNENLDSFNNFLQNLNVRVLPKLNNSDFELSNDNYHWTKPTANKFLNHWLKHLNF